MDFGKGFQGETAGKWAAKLQESLLELFLQGFLFLLALGIMSLVRAGWVLVVPGAVHCWDSNGLCGSLFSR